MYFLKTCLVNSLFLFFDNYIAMACFTQVDLKFQALLKKFEIFRLFRVCLFLLSRGAPRCLLFHEKYLHILEVKYKKSWK